MPLEQVESVAHEAARRCENTPGHGHRRLSPMTTEAYVTKRCNCCREPKPLCAFQRNSTAPDGLQARCRDCQKVKARSARRKALLARGGTPFEAVTRWIEGRHYTVDNATGCWVWTCTVNDDGYGIGKRNGKKNGAHRIAWEDRSGSVPAGHEVHHACHTRDLTCPGGRSCLHRRCVNPDHLRVLTRAQHTKLRGPASHTISLASLSDGQAEEIRTLRATTSLTYAAIGERYGVSMWVVRNIVTRRTYV